MEKREEQVKGRGNRNYMEVWLSGPQRLTVNQLPNGIVGSNPTAFSCISQRVLRYVVVIKGTGSSRWKVGIEREQIDYNEKPKKYMLKIYKERRG